MKSIISATVALGAIAPLLVATPAAAWGDLGHKVAALIAYGRLTPKARVKVDALLASDPDPLTAPDIADRATWADRYTLPGRPTFADRSSIALAVEYPARAERDAAVQLQKAGIKIAATLNQALGD